ncbi:hypothetical protein EVAR_56937_1 [Eumeta japonica]|uniref:Uncharacterized protein n=1 Tax=Eumeta variegata TaxID=151549 RepID=A0A4C1YBT2_EUMVA|nr:hypothetical protein EVAR_56937_1 [Eumeta japonica]
MPQRRRFVIALRLRALSGPRDAPDDHDLTDAKASGAISRGARTCRARRWLRFSSTFGHKRQAPVECWIELPAHLLMSDRGPTSACRALH